MSHEFELSGFGFPSQPVMPRFLDLPANLPSFEGFLTEDQIIESLFTNLSDSDLREWKAMPEEDLIATHHNTGRWLRNMAKLWDKDNPHVVHDDVNHDNFPDQMSHRIITKVWKKVQAL